MGCRNDGSLGPAVRGCRDDFDFTVFFEQAVLTIVPAAIFVLSGTWALLTLVKQPTVVRAPRIKTLKLILISCCVGVKFALIVFNGTIARHDALYQAAALPSSILDLVAMILLVPLSVLCHSRSPRPSVIITTYLLITLLFEVALVRTTWLLVPVHRQRIRSILITLSAVFKLPLLVVESWQKTRWLIWDRKDVSPEETCGIFSLGLFGWLNSLLLNGYRVVLSIENLYHLDNTMVADTLAEKVQQRHNRRLHRSQTWWLGVSLLRALYADLLWPVIPRIIKVATSFCQPFLIEAILHYLQPEQRDANTGYGLIAGTALIYCVIAVSTSLYWYLQQRFVIKVRGYLILAIYEKTTNLKASASDESGVLTLMSADVERIVTGFLNVHEYWASCVQVAVACYLLQFQLGSAFAAPIVVVVFSTALSSWVAKIAGNRQKPWMEAIEKRVAATASAIGDMKLVKMTGLVRPVERYIQGLRQEELQIGGRWRMSMALASSLAQVPLLASPVVTFAWTSKTLDTTSIFVSISYLTLLAAPLMTLFQQIPQLLAALTCLRRIQTFLEKESRSDYRQFDQQVDESAVPPDTNLHNDAVMMENISVAHSSTKDIVITNASFGWKKEQSILTDVSLRIPSSQLTIVHGPVASGKTTFCKALLGEVPFAKGSVKVPRNLKVGYCDQEPFLANASIRANIVGFSPFSPDRYQSVIKATMLNEDIALLPQGDSTSIGSGGASLSGGQRHRVAMARALYAMNTDLFIFDNSLSSLDANTSKHVFDHVFAPGGLARRSAAAVILCSNSDTHLSCANHIIKLASDGTVTETHGNFEGDIELPIAHEMVTSNVEIIQSMTELEHTSNAVVPDNTGNARQMGDRTIYLYYIRTMQMLPLFVFLAAALCGGFFVNFPKIWLTFWADDYARDRASSHSQGYYIGIYALLQGLEFCACFVAAVTILGPLILQSGSVLHCRALQTVVNASLGFLTMTDVGLITNYFSQDITLIDGSLPIAALNLALDLISVTGMAAVLASSAPWLLLSYPVLLFVLWAIQHFYLRTSRQVRLLDLEAKSPLYSHFIDTVKGAVTIRAFGWEAESKAHNANLLDRSQRPVYFLALLQRWLYLTMSMVVAVIATGLVALITQLKAGAGLSGASLVTLMSLSESLIDIVRFYASLETSISAVVRLKNFTSSTETETCSGEREPASDWPHSGSIEVKGVWASYNGVATECALQGLNVSIRAGERVAICGRTGSGKSSFLSLLLRLLEPVQRDNEEATLSIDEVPLASIDRQRLRERIITVPQDALFLPMGTTVKQNLDPFDAATHEMCETVLRDVRLHDAIDRAGGLDAILSDGALSYGQRQLFSVARAVLKKRLSPNRSLLLLDEVNSSLDAATEREIVSIIRREFEGWTVVMISHRLDLIEDFVDRVIVFNQGVVVETGKPSVLKDMEQGWYAHLLANS